MKYFKCENCGSELTKNADNTYTCGYCRRTYYDDSLEKAYDRVYQNLRGTVQELVSEEFVKQKIEQIATCRQALYKERNEQFVDNTEIERWAGEILKLSPKDAQANFYFLAAKKRWSELNKFMQKLNAKEIPYLVEGFVDYLTNGQFVEKCVLCLSDLIDRAFSAGSKEYEACHKKIVVADERERSGIFDVSLPRDVFVAYSSKDKEKAYELVEYLEKNGFTCFIAMRNLAKGVDAALKYNERLKTAMDSCRVFLLVSSTNSRARDCDAYRIEMQYIRDCDCRKANDSALASARYDEYLEKNRKRCKSRLEYLIEEYGMSPYERNVKKFFNGLTWCRSLESVSDAVFELIEDAELAETEEEKLARERAEFEVQKAEIERQKAELARKEQELAKQASTAPMGNVDDLIKAIEQRQREAEEEKKRQAEETERKRKEEEERKRRQAEEAERKRKEEEIQKYISQNFEVEENVLKKYIGSGGDVIIPEGITKVQTGAFKKCTNITNVTISDTVAVIEKDAFSYCDNLRSITISSGVKLIEDYAFFGCKTLQEINVDEKNAVYSSIDGNFYSKNGKRLIQYASGKLEREFFIPRGVKCIGFDAFHYCSNLEKVIVPSSVHVIEKHAFYKCFNLRIEGEANEIPHLEEQWNPNNLSVEWGVLMRNEPVFQIPEEEVELVSDIENFEIENGILKKYNGNSHYVNIPEGVNVITKEAFLCAENLVGLTLPKSLVCIESEAFIKNGRLLELCNKSCLNLAPRKTSYGWVSHRAKNIRSADDVSKIGVDSKGYVFYTDETAKILVTYIGEEKNLVLPDTVTEIYGQAFGENKKIESLKLPDSVTKFHLGTFNGLQNLTELEFSENTTEIFNLGSSAPLLRYNEFSNGKYLGTKNNKYFALVKATDYDIQSCEIHKDTRIIVSSAFKKCKNLHELRIPSLVQYIGFDAFAECTNLARIDIPKSVLKIGSAAFKNCSALTIWVESEIIPEGWDSSGFLGGWNPNKRPVILDCAKKWEEERKRKEEEERQKRLEEERKRKEAEEAERKRKEEERKRKEEEERQRRTEEEIRRDCDIVNGALKKYRRIFSEEAIVPNGVTSIDEFAFNDCVELKSVVIPASVTSISEIAFSGCLYLQNIKVDKNNRTYKDIDGNLYSKDGKTLIQYAKGKYVEEFSIPSGVVAIDNQAFTWCNNLTSVIIPDSVILIGHYAFAHCASLKKIFIPNSVAMIGGSFCQATSLTIYAEAKSKPKGWYSVLFGKEKGNWNPEKRPVVWGATKADFDKA